MIPRKNLAWDHYKEAHREAERRTEREAERMLGDRYEQPEGSGKAPVDLETSFMQVINDSLISRIIHNIHTLIVIRPTFCV